MIVSNKCLLENEKNFILEDDFNETVRKPRLLLHSCCGPCSTAVVERLVDEFEITVFFYNPCITEEQEYQKRRAAQIEFIDQFNRENIGIAKIGFAEGNYRPKEFITAVEGLENEPEGGARCRVCFSQRLEKTAESVLGRELAARYGISFLDRDFKKKDGFKRSVELSKKYGLYRQNYCGCKYSKREGDD